MYRHCIHLSVFLEFVPLNGTSAWALGSLRNSVSSTSSRLTNSTLQPRWDYRARITGRAASFRVTLSLTDWLTHWQTHWLTHSVTHWLIDLLTHSLNHWLIDSLHNWLLTRCITDLLPYWLTELLTYRPSDLLTYWLICCLNHSLTHVSFKMSLHWDPNVCYASGLCIGLSISYPQHI